MQHVHNDLIATFLPHFSQQKTFCQEARKGVSTVVALSWLMTDKGSSVMLQLDIVTPVPDDRFGKQMVC